MGAEGESYAAKSACTFDENGNLVVDVTDQKLGEQTPEDIHIKLKRKKPAKD